MHRWTLRIGVRLLNAAIIGSVLLATLGTSSASANHHPPHEATGLACDISEKGPSLGRLTSKVTISTYTTSGEYVRFFAVLYRALPGQAYTRVSFPGVTDRWWGWTYISPRQFPSSTSKLLLMDPVSSSYYYFLKVRFEWSSDSSLNHWDSTAACKPPGIIINAGSRAGSPVRV